MTQNSKRIAVILSVLILVIGFAAVTTTLVLNGGLLVGEADDFKIIFTEAILDGRKDNSLISSDKKTITFESKELLDLNDKTTLEYMVANTSRNYDANVSVNCSISSDTNEYVYVRNNPSRMIVEAGTSKKGTIEVELIKVLTESKEVSLTCELVSTPIERDSLGDEYVTPGVRTLMKAEFDWNGRPISGKFWNYNEDIIKVVFEDALMPHETRENLIFDVSMNQDRSVIAYLVPNDTDNYVLYIQADGKIIANENSSLLFCRFENLEVIEGFENLDTKNVRDMGGMFEDCFSLKDLNLSSFDTSSLIDVAAMFQFCRSLVSINFQGWNTEKLESVAQMFNGCQKLEKLDLSSFDSSTITSIHHMFQDCSSLIDLDLSGLDLTIIIDSTKSFYLANFNLVVVVKDELSKEWLLNLGTNDRPSAWSTANVVIKE